VRADYPDLSSSTSVKDRGGLLVGKAIRIDFIVGFKRVLFNAINKPFG